jgi:hypothetical protein
VARQAEQLGSITALEQAGWRVVFARDGYLVLHQN